MTRSFLSSGRKKTMSEMRFRNSGLKTRLASSSTFSRIFSASLKLERRRGEAHRGLALQQLRADVRGHDDDRVPEIHRAAERVGQAAVLQDLEQDLQHVGVGLLDLVEEDDRVGPAAHRLGQLAALLVADVARGRADEPRDGELLHVLAHVDLHERVLLAEHLRGELLGGLGLADAGRARRRGTSRSAGAGSLRSARERRSARAMELGGDAPGR